MYLIDTNVFLEFLLDQENAETASQLFDKLINGPEPIFITGFTLHSIIVILERLDKDKELRIFVETISNIPHFKTIYLDFSEERQVIKEKEILNLDFDDAYQYYAAKKMKASIITFDKDFEKIQDVLILSPVDILK